MRKIVQRIRPEGMATVVRTAASGVSDAELIADLGVLLRMWHGIVEQYNRAPSPSLLHKDMNLVFKAARDFITVDVGRVLVDDAEESDKIRDFMRLLGPQYLDRIENYTGAATLFADYHVDDEVSKLMRPKVNLPSGGSIVVETTEAFTVIDVNSRQVHGRPQSRGYDPQDEPRSCLRDRASSSPARHRRHHCLRLHRHAARNVAIKSSR